MVAHIHIIIYLKAILLTCGLHKLPPALRTSRRGDALQPTLDDTQILEVLRHTLLFQNAFDSREIASGTLDVEQGV